MGRGLPSLRHKHQRARVSFCCTNRFSFSGVTQYLVVFPLNDDSLLAKSASLKRWAKWKKKAQVVSMDWLLNSLEEGEEKPANDYQIEGYTQDI